MSLELLYRGLVERGRIATSSGGLLVIAAAVVLFTMVTGLTWAERLFLYNGEVAARRTDGPGTWSGIALTISAFTILAGRPFHAVDSTRRRRTAACISFIAALLVWSAPFAIFKYLVPDAGQLVEYLGTNVAGISANWSITVPYAASVSAGTWLALNVLSRMRPRARRGALAAGLVAAGAVAVALTWTRPDLVAPYGQSAFADLGAGVFVTALGMLLAAVAVLRPAGGYPPPPGAPGPR